MLRLLSWHSGQVLWASRPCPSCGVLVSVVFFCLTICFSSLVGSWTLCFKIACGFGLGCGGSGKIDMWCSRYNNIGSRSQVNR